MTVERTTIAGRYELDPHHLGQGGMGQVYAGYDQKLDRKVAVKLVRFPFGQYDEQLVKRFRHEARVMAKLEHPGAPVLYDADVHDDPRFGPRPFLVMQFIDGVALDDLLAEEGPLPVGWVAAIAAQVVAVLHAAHERGIFHRDLKPSNLMLCSDGSLKVLDFGLAMFHDPELSRLTRTGTILGTPAYMSPEQIRGAAIGPQSDFYSLGLVLHELLTGTQLFSGQTEFSVFEQHINQPATPVSRYRQDVPEALDALILRMLAKRPEDRPSEALALHTELLAHAVDLPRLPQAVDSTLSSLRLYAAPLARISSALPVAVSSEPAPSWDTGESPHGNFSRSDLARARAEAESLARVSRYGQAVEVLTSVLGPAGQALGSLDADVLELRVYLAEVWFESGDYRKAASAFAELKQALASRYGPRDERVLSCRRQEATCQALLGNTTKAIELVRDLLSDEEVIYGLNEPPVLELRRQLGLLLLGAGDSEQAARTLSELLEDLTELHGPDHPDTKRVRDSLTRLSPR